MSKKLLVAAVCFFILVVSATAKAVAIRMPSVPERVAAADAIVVGKVESIEDKTVKAKPIYGGDEIEYQVAVVKIGDGVSGVKGLTHVKVAFQVPVNQPGGPIRPGRRPLPPKLEKDQEVCLLLTKHPTENFYVLTNTFQVFDKTNETFDKEVEQVKKLSKLLDDADKSLKSKDADEKFLTAAMLLAKYRPQFTPVNAKTEDIDAAQSKAILETLAGADFNKQYPELQGWNAITAFYRLGLTDKDGWKFPQNATQEQIIEAAKKWLKDNAGSYRIQKVVPEKTDK
jgi:hypothetical protein